MKFMQCGINYWETQISTFVCLVIGIIGMALDSVLMPALLFPSSLLVVVLIVERVAKQNYILMNEEGIFCHRGEKLCWGYRWTEIAELKIGNRFRFPSIDIVLKPEYRFYRKEFETTEAYFQLGTAAKKAIKLYCKCPITKML